MKFEIKQSNFLKLLEETWPAEKVIHFDNWKIRISDGAGKRASAISLEGNWEEASFRKLKEVLKKLGKSEIFMIYQSNCLFDKKLKELNYQIFDRSCVFEISVAELIKSEPPPMRMFSIWPALHVQKELWSSHGIGWQRQAVMDRVSSQKTSILARSGDNPVASAFVAKSGDVAFLHALVVDRNSRRQGVARALMKYAGQWANKNNCAKLMVVTTETNAAATSLYSSLEFQLVNKYHYRIPKA
jgi:GNAT superfamily N-acetyltransferase